MEADERSDGEAVRPTDCRSLSSLLTNIKKEIFLFDTKIYSASASTLAMRALQMTFLSQNSLSVDHTNGQLLSTLDDINSLASRDAVSDLSAVLLVVHHEKLQVLHVSHRVLVETVRKHVAGSGIRTVTNIGHQGSTTEATSAATINTLGLSPVLLHISPSKHATYVHSLELIGLETGERHGSLLHNLDLTCGAHSELHTELEFRC